MYIPKKILIMLIVFISVVFTSLIMLNMFTKSNKSISDNVSEMKNETQNSNDKQESINNKDKVDNSENTSNSTSTNNEITTTITQETKPNGNANNNTTTSKVNSSNLEVTNNNSNTQTTSKIKNTIPATISYSCPNEHTKNGTKCIKEYVSLPFSKTVYSCFSGTLDGNKCLTSLTREAYVECTKKGISYNQNTPDIAKTCCNYAGGTFDSEKFPKEFWCNTSSAATSNLEYYCAEGSKMVGGQCVYESISDAFEKYSCPEGYYLSGTNCIEI